MSELSLMKQLLTLPNMLSIVRLLLVPVFLWLLLVGEEGIALITLIVASATDYLDGYFARRLNQVTRIGQLLDPAADRLYILATLIGLAATAHIPVWLPFVIIGRDVLLLVTYPMLASRGYGPLPVHFVGKAGTFALLYAFPLLMLVDVWQGAENLVLPVAWAFAIWGIGLYWWAGCLYLRQLVQIVKSTSKNATRLGSKGGRQDEVA
ncbi:MAG: CDP-alcohol phosphatidyltransferase family protein [Microbacteriaceae bacterium]